MREILNNSKEYISSLKDKIRKEASKAKLNYNNSISTEGKKVYTSLAEAEKNAKIGTTIPSFSSSFFLKRKIYRLVTRFVLKVLKLITLNQRQFNLSILDAVRGIMLDKNNTVLRLAEIRTALESKDLEQEVKIKEQDSKMLEIEKNLSYFKRSLVQLEQKISNLRSFNKDSEIKKVGKSNIDMLDKSIKEIDHSLDSFYVFLEENFRGEKEDIKKRFKVYLPVIKEAKVGSSKSIILDIGCGRGEWLELLKENGFYAKGLDLNEVMVRICKERKLDAVEGEALSFLESVTENSIGAVTGFHIIEHYPFNYLIKLVDEVLRVLKPGGLAIFETPNPNNVLVGSCSFYLDPTHLKPLPSSLVKLVLESRGFSNIEIINLNPYNDKYRINNEVSETAKRFNDYFYGPQDYAVIGYKL